MLTYHLYIFGEVSVRVFGPFFSWVVCFLVEFLEFFVYFLDISPLADVSFANIFLHSVACFLIFLILSCRAEVFNFNEV